MPAMPPAYVANSMHITESALAVFLRSYVQEQYVVRVAILRDLALDKYHVAVEIIRPDWSLLGRLDEVVEDLKEFPSATFRTQLVMLAG
jgi:hypothetical protein